MFKNERTFRIECPAGECPAAKVSPDITKSNIPLMVAVALSLAIAAAAFHVGGIFSSYQTERSEILGRLDTIEGDLRAIAEHTGVKVAVKKKRPQQTSETH
jgi:hypothetical protein